MDFVRQLKEQINIADVVGEYVRLRKTGSNYMGLCPFHGERTPSFSVSEKKGLYHCFGCARNGDVIKFVQEIQAVSFPDAVRTLAQKFGIKLPPEFNARGGAAGAPTEDKLEVYYKLNRFVAQFYHEKLAGPAGKAAREYLLGRGINEATIKTAYLGYAPADWAELYDFLVEKKAPLDKAEELGLIRRKGNGADLKGRAHYDLFRDRVMFPVLDTRGRVIAFGGRALGESDGPKYLNSSESPVFKKGSHLFGIFFAQKEIRAEDLCVVVEGFMDCLALQQAGIGYTVATLGTALSERQVAMLKRLTKNIVVLFDGDNAGREAQTRALDIFLNEDVVAKGASLPQGLDPDEFVKARGAEELVRMIRNAPYLLDQRILELAAEGGAHAESRSRAVDQILPSIAKISSDTARMVRVQEISNLFDIRSDLLERRIAELRAADKAARPAAHRPAAVARPPASRQAQSRASSLDALDVKLIEYLVKYPKFIAGADFASMLSGLEAESVHTLASRLVSTITQPLASDALEWTEAPALKAVLSRAMIEAEQAQAKTRAPEEEEVLVREIQDFEWKLVRRGLERRKDTLRAIIMKAEGSGQSTEFSRLMSEYNELVRRLDETNATARAGGIHKEVR